MSLQTNRIYSLINIIVMKTKYILIWTKSTATDLLTEQMYDYIPKLVFKLNHAKNTKSK